MVFKHTYQDWKQGNIIWNSIESNKYVKDYISDACKEKIKLKQRQILKYESTKLVENLVSTYNLDRRNDTNRTTTFNKFLETINNLLNGDVDSFKDTIILDEEEAMTQPSPIENKVKIVPPLDWLSFSKIEIIGIQKAYQDFYKFGKWNAEVVETPKREELWKYVDFRYTVFAKAYHDFGKRLRQYDGLVSNTFQSKIDSYYLALLRSDLIRLRFISNHTDRELFIKMFQGYYLMSNERVIWIKNLDCLRYLIILLEKLISHHREYGKWQVVCNCFVKDGNIAINPDSLRKATKIENNPIEKQQLEDVISRIR